MASSINPALIDPTFPATGVAPSKATARSINAGIQTNFTAAKSEIETLQADVASVASGQSGIMPSGTTATRPNPASLPAGFTYVRYNTDLASPEFYNPTTATWDVIDAGTSWVTAALQNSWVAHDDWGGQDPQYRRSGGVVELRGLVKNGVLGQPILTLPVGFRPALIEHAVVLSLNDANGDFVPAPLTIDTDGVVVVQRCEVARVSLAGVRFEVA